MSNELILGLVTGIAAGAMILAGDAAVYLVSKRLARREAARTDPPPRAAFKNNGLGLALLDFDAPISEIHAALEENFINHGRLRAAIYALEGKLGEARRAER